MLRIQRELQPWNQVVVHPIRRERSRGDSEDFIGYVYRGVPVGKADRQSRFEHTGTRLSILFNFGH